MGCAISEGSLRKFRVDNLKKKKKKVTLLKALFNDSFVLKAKPLCSYAGVISMNLFLIFILIKLKYFAVRRSPGHTF